MTNAPSLIERTRRYCLAATAAALLSACATQGSEPRGIEAVVDPALNEAAVQAEARLDYEGAAGYYRSLATRNPDNPLYVVKQARMLRFQGLPDRAEPLLVDGLERFPDEPRLLMEWGKTQIALGRAEDAVKTLEAARAATADDWRAYSALGVAYDHTGDLAKAQEIYQLGLGFSPSNPILLNNLALSLAQAGVLDEAVRMMERAVAQPEATAQMRQNLALLKALQGDPLAAERLAREDLPAAMADKNARYYRILSDQSSHGRRR